MPRPWSNRLAVIALAVVSALVVVPGWTAAGPDSHTQPLIDGCQRSQSLLLGTSTPEWVYVNANDVRAARVAGDATLGRKTVEGVVHESRPAGEDIYVSHDFHDYNVMITPDPAYEGLLGSGNRIPGNEKDLLEGEWEVSAIPLWAWPSAGDRVKVSGNWIWDCGHWGNSAADPTGLSQLLVYDPLETLQDIASPGAIRGETTELHPMYEIATYRANAANRLLGYGPKRVSRLDVWINGDGTPAHSTEECALRGISSWALARALCPQARDVAGTYTYTMRLGAKPSAASRIVINPVLVHDETRQELVRTPVSLIPNARAGTVTVRFTLPHTVGSQKFGITVVAGWSDAPRAIAHRVKLDTIKIVRSLDGASEPHLNPAGFAGEQTPDPAEWVLYANVSGRWVQIPGIAQVRDGQVVPIGITLDFFLPQGVTPRLYVSGHECDEPLMDCTSEGRAQSAKTFSARELGFNDRPGRIQAAYFGVLMRPGTVVYRPPANPDLGSGVEDLSDGICGTSGCYLLTARWIAGR